MHEIDRRLGKLIANAYCEMRADGISQTELMPALLRFYARALCVSSAVWERVAQTADARLVHIVAQQTAAELRDLLPWDPPPAESTDS